MKIAMSTGHSTQCRGAVGYVDEVDEAIKIMGAVADALRQTGVDVVTFTDTVSTTQNENLNRLVDWHNQQTRDLDVSFHENAYQKTSKPMGCEVCYLTQDVLAGELSAAIATAGAFVNRGGKKRTDLFWLNNTAAPAVLLETFFVDSSHDVDTCYKPHFDDICQAIATTLSGEEVSDQPSRPSKPPVAPLAVSPPTIGIGDRGSSVAWVQRVLKVPNADGEFGGRTEKAVETYQAAKGLSVDGIVGPTTWAQLDADYDLPVYPPPALPPLPADTVKAICDAALASAIAKYYWSDRGVAPDGYMQGFAFSYATMVRKLKAKDPVALITAQGDRHDKDHDALTWYAAEFKKVAMSNVHPGLATLRHLFVLLMGLGIRESSGRHCCGKDQSASNTTSDTCESGLYQTSWNASACSSDMQRLLDEYTAIGEAQQSGAALFKEDVTCSQAEWTCYGSGTGFEYQMLAKKTPAFAVESTALGLRYLRQHWGPINRKEVELRKEADRLLRDVEDLVTDVVA